MDQRALIERARRGDHDAFAELVDGAICPVRDPDRFAERELVDAALRRLDPGHRAVVALHNLLGMPLSDVAASLGITYGTAKSRRTNRPHSTAAGLVVPPGVASHG